MRIIRFFLHDWEDIGTFSAEGGEFTRQQCRGCLRCRKEHKTRVTRLYLGRHA